MNLSRLHCCCCYCFLAALRTEVDSRANVCVSMDCVFAFKHNNRHEVHSKNGDVGGTHLKFVFDLQHASRMQGPGTNARKTSGPHRASSAERLRRCLMPLHRLPSCLGGRLRPARNRWNPPASSSWRLGRHNKLGEHLIFATTISKLTTTPPPASSKLAEHTLPQRAQSSPHTEPQPD